MHQEPLFRLQDEHQRLVDVVKDVFVAGDHTNAIRLIFLLSSQGLLLQPYYPAHP